MTKERIVKEESDANNSRVKWREIQPRCRCSSQQFRSYESGAKDGACVLDSDDDERGGERGGRRGAERGGTNGRRTSDGAGRREKQEQEEDRFDLRRGRVRPHRASTRPGHGPSRVHTCNGRAAAASTRSGV